MQRYAQQVTPAHDRIGNTQGALLEPSRAFAEVIASGCIIPDMMAQLRRVEEQRNFGARTADFDQDRLAFLDRSPRFVDMICRALHIGKDSPRQWRDCRLDAEGVDGDFRELHRVFQVASGQVRLRQRNVRKPRSGGGGRYRAQTTLRQNNRFVDERVVALLGQALCKKCRGRSKQIRFAMKLFDLV